MAEAGQGGWRRPGGRRGVRLLHEPREDPAHLDLGMNPVVTHGSRQAEAGGVNPFSPLRDRTSAARGGESS